MVKGLENHIRHGELGVHPSQQVIGVMLVYSSVDSLRCLEEVQKKHISQVVVISDLYIRLVLNPHLAAHLLR